MDSTVRYPWQQTVLDAFMASPDVLPLKINLAEKAIAGRLNDPQLGNYERIALRDPLNVLHVLIAESRAYATLKDRTEDGHPRETLKYAWQEAVLEAFVESRPEHLPKQVNVAQRAIYQRLSDPTLTDLDERIALREALLNLRELLPKRRESKEAEDEKRSA